MGVKLRIGENQPKTEPPKNHGNDKNEPAEPRFDTKENKDVKEVDLIPNADEHGAEITDDNTEYTDDDSLSDPDENVTGASSSDVNTSKDREEKGLLSELGSGLMSTLNKFNPFKKKKKVRVMPIYSPYCPNDFYLIYATSEGKYYVTHSNYETGFLLSFLLSIRMQLSSPTTLRTGQVTNTPECFVKSLLEISRSKRYFYGNK